MANNSQMQSELEDRTASSGYALADKAADLAGKAGQTWDKATDAVSASGREAGERVGEVAGNVKSAVDKSLTEQPMATLAIAAAVGFVMGAIWKS